MGWANFEVQCGFGGGEETTRFGPRQEIGSSLYQVDTVACVNNQTDVSFLIFCLCCGFRFSLNFEFFTNSTSHFVFNMSSNVLHVLTPANLYNYSFTFLIWLCIHPSIYTSIHLPLYLFTHLFIHQSLHLPISPYVGLSSCLSNCFSKEGSG